MALIRIEPKQDNASGDFYLEIYHPHDAAVPFITTQPRYKSAAMAETDVIAILAAAASSVRG